VQQSHILAYEELSELIELGWVEYTLPFVVYYTKKIQFSVNIKDNSIKDNSIIMVRLDLKFTGKFF